METRFGCGRGGGRVQEELEASFTMPERFSISEKQGEQQNFSSYFAICFSFPNNWGILLHLILVLDSKGPASVEAEEVADDDNKINKQQTRKAVGQGDVATELPGSRARILYVNWWFDCCMNCIFIFFTCTPYLPYIPYGAYIHYLPLSFIHSFFLFKIYNGTKFFN